MIISSSTCTGCKKCIDNCPVSILEIKDNVASVKSLQNGKCIDSK
nr:4Fe-4S dicluster domain-containing protein [Campylobacter sp.]